ncbi:hypothetical protein MTP03_06590 [Tsukamurella sp. PLM1]|nr:hypothetical protein MTP03_06590 [Tsukamurella sp. PLM1]
MQLLDVGLGRGAVGEQQVQHHHVGDGAGQQLVHPGRVAHEFEAVGGCEAGLESEHDQRVVLDDADGVRRAVRRRLDDRFGSGHAMNIRRGGDRVRIIER